MTDLLRRSVETFIQMQEEYLKIAGKQTHTWVEAAKAGKPYQPEHVVDLAREGMENFVKAQKRFLDVIAEETAKATSGKSTNGAGKKMKQTELSASSAASDGVVPRSAKAIGGRRRAADECQRENRGEDAWNFCSRSRSLPVERTNAGGREELRRCPEGVDGRDGQVAECMQT